MVIIGFPCIGKSSVSIVERGYIDLESSFYKKDEGWEIGYCEQAINLSNQGYFVFVSSHNEVREYLEKNQDKCHIMEIFPDESLESEWIERALNRYNKTKEEKDKRAFEYIKNNFSFSVQQMKNDRFMNKCIITSDVKDDLDKCITTFVEKHGALWNRNLIKAIMEKKKEINNG